MSEENLVDIFSKEESKNNLVTATVSTNEETGYVNHVHLDIKKPEQYHFTSDGIEDKIEENEYAGKNVFNETEEATVSPTGSKVDINIHEVEIPDIPEYKSDLMKNLPYDISCDYANVVKNTIYASIPPMVNIAYPIVEWYQHITGKVDYELTFPVKFCLDEIAEHYENLEKEYDEFKRSVATDKKLWDMKERRLEKEIKFWKFFGNCATAVMFALMGYILYTIL